MFGHILSKVVITPISSFADLLRKHRESAGKPLREVADKLQVDVSLVSKWERGERKPDRKQVVALAKYLKADADDLVVAWLRDKVVYEVQNDELALKAMQAAEAQVAYNPLGKATIERTIERLKELLRAQPLIERAWLFGSFARKEARLGSDIDLMVEFDPKQRVSLFDLIGMAEEFSVAIGRKVDLVEKGQLKDFAERTARKDMTLIHG